MDRRRVGSGGLWRGHSDNNPANALVSSTDNDPYSGTGNVSPSIERRIHTLSNGEIIWDLGGNVWEWTNDTIVGVQKPNDGSGLLWQEWTSVNSNFRGLSYDLTRPSNNTWNSTQNMGSYYAGNFTLGTFGLVRSGFWNGNSVGTSAGLFNLSLANSPATTSSNTGFRCVIR